MKYYLVGYYARLKGGGFGFSRMYWAAEMFDIIEFEQQIASETNLAPNDICVISRVTVDVEEFNYNTKKAEEEKRKQDALTVAKRNQLEMNYGTKTEPETSEPTEAEVR